MKIRVELQKVVTLDYRVVEADTTAQAEELALEQVHKYDLNDCEMVKCYCAHCDQEIIDNECPYGCEEDEEDEENETDEK